MNCNGDCGSCGQSCKTLCPKCSSIGMEVPTITVANLTSQKVDLNKTYFLCTGIKCDVAYFDEVNKTILTDDVKEPVWYKSTYDKYLICYCRHIYLKDVVKAVLSLNGSDSKAEIIKYLGKDQIQTNCLLNNPTGKSCEKLFDNAIIYAINIYNKLQKQENQKEEK